MRAEWPGVRGGILFIDWSAGAALERERHQQTIPNMMAAMPRKWYVGSRNVDIGTAGGAVYAFHPVDSLGS
jgi:hypothetical protein